MKRTKIQMKDEHFKDGVVKNAKSKAWKAMKKQGGEVVKGRLAKWRTRCFPIAFA